MAFRFFRLRKYASKRISCESYLLIAGMLSLPWAALAEEDLTQTSEEPAAVITVQGESVQMSAAANILADAVKLKCTAPEAQAHKKLQELENEIGRSARAYGYYHLKSQYVLERPIDCWNVQVELEQGERTIIDQVDVVIDGEAADDAVFYKRIESRIPKTGEGLLHSAYDGLKKSILFTAAKRGYFDGVFTTNELKVNQDTNRAEIVLHYDSGIRYRVGEIEIEQDVLSESQFIRYLSIYPGEYFDDAEVVKTYQVLSDSGYFSFVEVSPRIENRSQGKVPVVVKVEKGKSISYSAGVGFSTDTGPRVKFYYRDRVANERGHSYRGELLLSPVESNLEYSYRIPDKKVESDYYEINAIASHEDTDTSVSDSILVGTYRANQLENGWVRNYGLQYTIEDFDVGLTEGRTRLLSPVLGFSRIEADSALRTRRGYRISTEMQGASEAVLSDIDMAQITAGIKYIQGLGDNFRLISRANLGYTVVNDFERLPSTLRYFAGGDNSIRGYKYESLGPENAEGEVIGGENLAVFSIEIDYEYRPGWSAAAFIDTGNAFNNADLEARTGAGVGIRWQSPIGPLRLDLAFPVNDDDDVESYRIHFTLGPDL